MMIDWLIVYDDDTSFASDQGGPEDAPRTGVQVVAVRDIGCGRRLLWHQDFYCWEDDTWTCHDSREVWRYIERTKWPIVLRGYWMGGAKFEKAYRWALEDVRLPPKVARHPREPGEVNDWNRYGNERE